MSSRSTLTGFLERSRAAAVLKWKYSIRFALILTAIAAWVFSSCSARSRNEKAASKLIEEQGRWVYYEHQYDGNGKLAADAKPKAPKFLNGVFGSNAFTSIRTRVLPFVQT